MDDDARILKLIKDRVRLADINMTNFVYFTPSERSRILAWLDSQQEDSEVRC